MRTAILTAVVALLGTACYSTPDRYYTRDDRNRAAVFEAQTTSGDFVRVQQDPRDGDLVIVDPIQLRGQRVAMVNRDTGRGVALVTIDTGPRRYYREGSGGDVRDRGNGEPDRH